MGATVLTAFVFDVVAGAGATPVLAPAVFFVVFLAPTVVAGPFLVGTAHLQ
jgi:hypothetical protein